MKHLLLLLALVLCSISPSLAQWVEPPEFEWAQVFGGFGTNWDDNVHLRGMEIDGDENVYVCGFFENFMCFGEDTCVYSATPDSSDIFLVKYDSLGNLLWLRTFGEGGIDEAVGLGVTPSQEVLLAINFTGVLVADDFTLTASTPDRYLYDAADCALLRLDFNGEVQSFIQPESNSINSIDLMTINTAGQYFIVGRTISDSLIIGGKVLSVTEGTTFFVSGFDSDDDLIYAERLYGQGFVQAFCVDGKGQVYLKGYFNDSMRIGDVVLGEKVESQRFIIKLSPFGELVWSRIFTTLGTDVQYIETDENDNVYLSGGVSETVSFDSITFVGGYFLLKLDKEMKAIWGYSFGQDRFAANNIAIHDQAIYTVGRFSFEQVIEDTIIYSSGLFPSALSSDILLLRHDPETGELIWFKQIGWTGNEGGGFLRGSEDGSLYLTGGFSDRYSYLDSIEMINPYPGSGRFFISRLQADSLPPTLQIPQDGWLIYPNPVQDILWIAGEWQDGEASIEMYSMDGRLVMNKDIQTSVHFRTNSLVLSENLAAGVYIIRIRQGEQTGSYKVQVSQHFP